jgi:protein involved in polysaccharide export with SLBB domain
MIMRVLLPPASASFLGLICVLLSGVPLLAQTAALPPVPGGVVLRAGDAVRLMVKDEPDLAGEYPVLEDGTVLLPLIGLVRVDDTDFADVLRRVRQAYAAELVSAVVVLQPLMRVRVLGEVRQPGLYLVDPTFDLGDVLAQAGGMMPSAATNRVMLVRDGRSERVDMRNGASPVVSLRPADEIVVPRRSWVSESVPLLIGAGTSVLAAAVTALLVR